MAKVDHPESWADFRSRYEQDNRARYPNVPDHARVPFKYSDATTNQLTRCVIDFITFDGGHANRINSAGIYDQKRGAFRTGTTKRGTADIIATVRGRSLHIEIKGPGDRQSDAQKKYQQEIEAAGGVYFVATSFPQFWLWYRGIIIPMPDRNDTGVFPEPVAPVDERGRGNAILLPLFFFKEKGLRRS